MPQPSERFRAKKAGLTVGGRVFKEGESFGYKDLSMASRDRVWERLTAGDMDDAVEKADAEEAQEMDVVASTVSGSPSQPQGSPEGPLPGDSDEALAAEIVKEREAAGVVSQAAGLQGNTGASVEADAERARKELEFRGEANPAAKAEPMPNQPSEAEEAAKERDEEMQAEAQQPKGRRGKNES